MRIDIWSDIMCPFCYIGKHRLEAALKELDLDKETTLVWHSFQLNPNLETQPELNVLDHLAAEKGWTESQVKQMTKHVVEMGATMGLTLDFDKAVVANSRLAHRLIHFAQAKNKGSEMKEALLKAYFEEGINVDDWDSIKNLALAVGISPDNLEDFGNQEAVLDKKVTEDIDLARKIGISGVPFFIINNKQALSGAQEVSTFKQVLTQANSLVSK